MNSAKYILTITDVTLYESHMMFFRYVIYITSDSKLAIFCRQLCLCHLLYMLYMYSYVILQIIYSYEFKIVFFCKLPEVWGTHHSSIIFHDFTAHSTFLKSCQLHQINRCLCMSIPDKYTAFSCYKWKNMSRVSEILRL